MSFRNVLVFSLNNLPRLPLSLVLFICPSPVSIYFSLSLTDRNHWHWYLRWLPTNHLSTMPTCPEWETWRPFGGNLDLFCKICDSVIFWDECGMRIYGSNAERFRRMRKGWKVCRCIQICYFLPRCRLVLTYRDSDGPFTLRSIQIWISTLIPTSFTTVLFSLVAFTPWLIPMQTSVADSNVSEAIWTCFIFQKSVTDVLGEQAILVGPHMGRRE